MRVDGKTMAQDLLPFRVNLSNLPLVLLSNSAYKAYDFDVPRSAVLSCKLSEGLLRAKLGFSGVVAGPCSLNRLPVRAVSGHESSRGSKLLTRAATS